ncbi:MAG: hypothetical protein ACE5G2_13475 [Candidatus Krumholzibacteriia bacterium]
MKALERIRASVLVVVVAVAPGLAACQGGPPLSLDAQQRIVDLEADYAAAVAAGDEQAAAQAEGEIAAIEAGAAEEQARTLFGWFGGLLDFIPGGTWLKGALGGPLIALAPLLWKRPRRHFGNAVKALNPWNLERSPGEAVWDVARMYGLRHSSPESESAAETTI